MRLISIIVYSYAKPLSIFCENIQHQAAKIKLPLKGTEQCGHGLKPLKKAHPRVFKSSIHVEERKLKSNAESMLKRLTMTTFSHFLIKLVIIEPLDDGCVTPV
jgi:hypothetical protein